MGKKLKEIDQLDSVHLIGIGGIGMSGIARLLKSKGKRVTGSDVKMNPTIKGLMDIGIKVFIGHNSHNLDGAQLVVYSSAIKQDNPEILEGKSKCIPVIKRAECLSILMCDKTVITVAGAHGKTTTSSLVFHLLKSAGLKPSACIGGIVKGLNQNAILEKSKFFVAEADESDGSFLYYAPDYSIITNIDYEHLDHFGNWKGILNAFNSFIKKTNKGGFVFICNDSEHASRLIKVSDKRIITFGLRPYPRNEYFPRKIEFDKFSSKFDVFFKTKRIGKVSLSLAGKHNISNALSVVALGIQLGLGFDTIRFGLKKFLGVERRFHIKFDKNDILLIDDYAHHPTEIRATLDAARALHKKRMLAIFQPHRFTRTKFLWNEFIDSFDFADKLILTDIYPASEQPIKGIDSQNLARDINKNKKNKCVYVPKEKIVDYARAIVRPGDLIMNMGAGDISKISDEFAKVLKR